jgi:pentose-5-phosphate-3-epimerase
MHLLANGVFFFKFLHLMGKLDADNWQELIQSIKSKGMRPGVSLRPGTPVEEVFPLVRQHLLQLLKLSCYT